MKERLPEIKIFYNSEAFWVSIYQKSNKIPIVFFNVKIKDQVDYQIIAKDQWALLAEEKKMRSYFEKKIVFHNFGLPLWNSATRPHDKKLFFEV